jgi:hypothetical protein
MVTRADFNLLQPGGFLNDTIVDFYLKHLELTRLGQLVPNLGPPHQTHKCKQLRTQVAKCEND